MSPPGLADQLSLTGAGLVEGKKRRDRGLINLNHGLIYQASDHFADKSCDKNSNRNGNKINPLRLSFHPLIVL